MHDKSDRYRQSRKPGELWNKEIMPKVASLLVDYILRLISRSCTSSILHSIIVKMNTSQIRRLIQKDSRFAGAYQRCLFVLPENRPTSAIKRL